MLWFPRFRHADSLRAVNADRTTAVPCIESLESRRLFSHTGFHIVQSGENETVWLSPSGRNAPMIVNNQTILSTVISAAVNVLTVYGTTGNDTITITNSQVILNSQILNFGSAAEIVYVDNGGNDSITINASQMPVFLYIGPTSSDVINTETGSVYLLYTG